MKAIYPLVPITFLISHCAAFLKKQHSGLLKSGLTRLKNFRVGNLPTRKFFSLSRFINKSIVANKTYYVYIRLRGLGFRAWRVSSKIILELGYSHYYSVNLPIHTGLKSVIRKDKIFIFSNNLAMLTQLKSFLASLRPLNPYTSKGLKVVGKLVHKKTRKKDRNR